MKILKKLLPIIGLLYFGWATFGAKRGVSYESTTTNVAETVHIRVHSLTNLAATASEIAGYDANQKLGSLTAAQVRALLSVPISDVTDPGPANIFPFWDDTGNEIDWTSSGALRTLLGLDTNDDVTFGTVTATTVTATTLAGAGGGITYNGAGNNGNLATSINTLQELNDAVDNLSLGGGGSAPTGTMVNSGASTQYAIPFYSGTDGTNMEPSLITTDATKTNLLAGGVNANVLTLTNLAQSLSNIGLGTEDSPTFATVIVGTTNVAGKLAEIEAASGGATALNNIGDASASGVIAAGGFTNQFTSSLDGGIVFSLYNTDADNATDTILWDWAFTDAADANSIFWRARSGVNGSIATHGQLSATAFTIGVPSTFSSDLIGGGTNVWGALAATAKLSGGNTLSGTQLLAEGASIQLDAVGSADGAFSGVTRTGTAGATLAFGDLIVLDATDSRWELADANSASGADGDSRGIIGICVQAAAADGSATTVLLSGIVRADAAFPALTINGPIYVSETAGDITQTSPTTEDNVVRILGAAWTADEIHFAPDRVWTVYDVP